MAIEAEAKALLNSVVLAADCCLKRVIFETDCQNLVKGINGNLNLRNRWGKIIRQIKRHLSSFEDVKFVFGGIKRNGVADLLAQQAHLGL